MSELTPPREDPQTIAAAEAAAVKQGRGNPAVAIAITQVKNAERLPYAQGVAQERQAFLDLRQSDVARSLRHLFFAERAAAKVPGMRDVKGTEVRKVGVLGAGTMGVGIAALAARAGLEVVLVERDAESLAAGMGRLGALLRLARRAAASCRVSR